MCKVMACACAKRWLAHVQSNGLRMAIARVNGACAKQLGEHAQGNCVAETSQILVSREFSRIFFHFHFSFSISSRFNFTFTSRKRVMRFYFSLFTSRKK